MMLSVCIPNFNYEKFLPRTLRTVLSQDGVDLEVVVRDNASTDRSVACVEEIGDARVRVEVNACNVGFAGNLDRAARMARGDWMLMLSSDDLVRPGALARYRALVDALGADGARAVITSAADVIDANDDKTDALRPHAALWTPADRAPALDAVAGGPVYRVAAGELLRRSLLQMKNPFNFLATAYPRALWQAIEGYGSGRLINPDKWFHLRLLGVAEYAYYIDAPHFAYRWHGGNQTAQQSATGALKYLIDEYATTLELDEALLKRATLRRDDVVEAFVEHDIGRHGLATLARGDAARARRIIDFGRAVYPWVTARNKKCMALAVLSRADRVGVKVAQLGRAVAGRQGQVA